MSHWRLHDAQAIWPIHLRSVHATQSLGAREIVRTAHLHIAPRSTTTPGRGVKISNRGCLADDIIVGVNRVAIERTTLLSDKKEA